MRYKRPAKRHRQKTIEMLTAYDENMNPIGDFPRPEVHYNAMWHKVGQCWIAGRAVDGSIRIYLQRRSFEKKSHPGRYDITAGGHVSAGESPELAMVRELQEETGLILKEEHLKMVGVFKEVSGNDHELAHIYVHFETDPPFRPGKEVIYMVSADLEDFRKLSEGTVDRIKVVPTVRTGPMKDEAFFATQENFCNHESFLSMVYPYIKENCPKAE